MSFINHSVYLLQQCVLFHTVSDVFLISNISIFHEDSFSKKVNIISKAIMSLIIIVSILILESPTCLILPKSISFCN